MPILILLAWSLVSVALPQDYPYLSAAVHWAMASAVALGVLVSVVLHELGHAYVARRSGCRPQGITLFIFGGVPETPTGPPDPNSDLYVAVAGPFTTAVLVGLLGLVALIPLPDPVAGVAGYLALINFMLLAFNVAPAFPLDGGRVLRAMLWHLGGKPRWATRLCAQIGTGFGLALMFLSVLHVFAGDYIAAAWWFVLGWFVGYTAHLGQRRVVVRDELRGRAVREFMHPNPVSVSPNLTVERLVRDYVYRYDHKMFPIARKGRLVGCVSTHEIKRVPRDQWARTTVDQIGHACDEHNVIPAHADAMGALRMMQRHGTSRALVVSSDRLLGVLTLKDLLGLLAHKVELEAESIKPLRDRPAFVSHTS